MVVLAGVGVIVVAGDRGEGEGGSRAWGGREESHR